MNELVKQEMGMVKREIHHAAKSISAALPESMKYERFAAACMLALEKNPDLLDANRLSLLKAVNDAANTGLLPDGREGALVIFKDQVQWMPMYQGLMKLAYQSGVIDSINVEVVRQDDEFELWTDDKGTHFKHVPNVDSVGPVRLAYAQVTTKDGGVFFERMNRKELDGLKQTSRTGRNNTGPWKWYYEEMCKKSVLRRLSKRLPLSREDHRRLLAAIEAVDAEYDFGNTQEEQLPQRQGGKPSVFDSVTEGESQ